jgi:OOP family OmpA-OmpF porin
MKIQRLIAAAVLAVGSVGWAQAETVYFGASLGVSDWQVDDVPGGSMDRTDFAYKLHAGAYVIPQLAVELGWVDLGRSRAKAAGATAEIKGGGVFLDLVGTLPMGEGWSLLGRAGAFNGKAKVAVTGLPSTSDSSTEFKYGFGIQWGLNRQVLFRGEWERYRLDLDGDKGDVDLWSVGVNYRF